MKELKSLLISILLISIGIMVFSCSKVTTSILTINNADVGRYEIYIYPINSVPTNWSYRPNNGTDAIAAGSINYSFSDKDRGEIAKVDLNWSEEGVLSGDFLIELSVFMSSGYIVTSFNKGNATIDFKNLTILNSPSSF